MYCFPGTKTAASSCARPALSPAPGAEIPEHGQRDQQQRHGHRPQSPLLGGLDRRIVHRRGTITARMARHVCTNCGATVVDEEFCPTCGSWIDPLTTERGRNSDEFEEFDLEDRPVPTITRTSEPLICPSCGATNPPNNRHC